MSDISQIALNGVTYNVKDSTARTEVEKKVTTSGGDITNTKVATYTASTASYPVPVAGETPKVFMGKIKKFFEDFKSFKDSIVTKTMIINQIINDSTKAASAATVYSVKQQVDQQNSDLAVTKTNMQYKNGWSHPDGSLPYIARSGNVISVGIPFCTGTANTVVCTIPAQYKKNTGSWIMFNYAGFDIRGMDIVAKNDRIEELSVTFIDF